MLRRTFLISTAAVFLQASASRAQSFADYPSKPVRIIVPFAAGGLIDVAARIIGQNLAKRLGGNVYVENVAGAGGNIGMGQAAKSSPDGYTILMVSSSFVVNPSLIPNTPYDPVKSFTPVTLVAAAPQVVVVNDTFPAKSIKELVSLVRAIPGKYNYASPGVGTTGHLAGEMFRLGLGLDLAHVPFNGAGPAVNSVVAGHTPIGFAALPSVATQVMAGRLRALAVTTAFRSPAFPDVPTLAEAGVLDQESDVMQGMLVPVGTPKEIVDRLQREIAAIVAQPEVKKQLEALGSDPVASKPEEFAARINVEVPRWAKVIREANIGVK